MLLGAGQFRQLLTVLGDEFAALRAAASDCAEAAQLAATLHRLQGSASALGLVETAAAVVDAAEQFAADCQILPHDHCRDLLIGRLVAPDMALARAETALAAAFPDLPRPHG